MLSINDHFKRLQRLPTIFRRRARAITPASEIGTLVGTHISTHTHSRPTAHHSSVSSGRSHRYLTDLLPEESGTIHAVKGTSEARLHLMEMGLTPGTEVRMCRRGVMGGPLDIAIRGYRLSLRRQEADAIELRSVRAL